MAFSIPKKVQWLLGLIALLLLPILFGHGLVYAATVQCTDISGNIHDFAGVEIGFQDSDGDTNFSGVNVHIVVQSPSYSDSNGDYAPDTGELSGYNLFDTQTGARATSVTFPATSSNGNCTGSNYGVVLSDTYNDGSVTGTGTPASNGDTWVLDCDYSYRAESGGPQANPKNPYQQFNVYPTGTPNGDVSGGTWTVIAADFKSGANTPDASGGGSPNTGAISGSNVTNNSSDTAQLIAPANGRSAEIVFEYTPPKQWSVTASSKVSDTTAVAGEEVEFGHQITNKSGSQNNANFTWQVVGNYTEGATGDSSTHNGGNAYTGANACGDPLPGNTTSSLAPGSSSPDGGPPFGNPTSHQGWCYYEFPTTGSEAAKNGDEYCQYVTWTPDSSSNSSQGKDSGSEACVTYKALCTDKTAINYGGSLPCKYSTTTGPLSLTGTCTSASFNTGSSYYSGGSSIRYAVFETPAGSAPPSSYSGATPSNPVTLTSTPQSSANGQWPAIGSDLYVTTGNTTASPNTNYTFPGSSPSTSTFSPSQYTSGTVTWYVVTYNRDNNSPVKTVNYTSNGKSYTTYTYTIYVVGYASATVNNCFQATCTITMTGDLDSTSSSSTADMKGGQGFTYAVSVTNTGSNSIAPGITPSYVNASTLSGSGLGTLGPGDSTDPPISYTSSAPDNDSDSNYLKATIGYPSNYTDLTSLASCQLNVRDYVPFTLTPTASAAPGAGATNEDPTTIDYFTKATNSNSAGVTVNSIPTESEVYYEPVGDSTPANYEAGGPGTSNVSYASGDTYTLPVPPAAHPGVWNPPSPYTAGDKYCSYINLSYNGGYVTADGSTLGDTTTATDSQGSPIPLSSLSCVIVTNEPYAHFFGAGVAATVKGFGDSCTALPGDASGGIYAFNKVNGSSYSGSGTQFGAQALNVIEGFGSAMLRTSTPVPAAGLTFANSNTGQTAPDYGGDIGTNGDCLPDYYSGSSGLSPTPLPGGGVSVGTNGSQLYNGSLVINGGTLESTAGGSSTTHQTIYVNGDVYIAGNITYADPNSWAQITDIPSFNLIASGNIYIAPGVTQLDGFYVAQPQVNASGTVTAGTGTIDTCGQANGTTYSAYNINDVYESCDSQLTVNGAFVADTVLLDRSYGSLRNSVVGENPATTAPHACSSYSGGSSTDCAAEIFNFSPEMLLSGQSLPPVSGPTTGTYDKITSLSPVLPASGN